MKCHPAQGSRGKVLARNGIQRRAMHECDNDRFVGSASVATNTRLRIRMEIVGALTTKGLRRVIETLTQDTLDGHSYSADRGSVKGIWA
jgi:hypothetical protein